MNDEQRYLFDLQGYLVLKGVVPKDVIETCNHQLDQIEQMPTASLPTPVLHGKSRTDNELYISNILEADPVFHKLINIPQVIDIIEATALGLYRLNHTYAIYRWGTGYTYMHMGSIPLHPKATYTCHGGQIFSLTTKAVFPLLNHTADDGCFACIPGSHKANFKRPWGNHPDENPPLIPIPAQPGDAIVFTEAVTHGSYVNKSGRPRRTVYYCYSVGYMPDWTKFGLHFSDKLADALTDDQRDIIRLKIS